MNTCDAFRAREHAERAALLGMLLALRKCAARAIALAERLHPGERALSDPLRLAVSHARDVVLTLAELTETDPSLTPEEQAPALRLCAEAKTRLDAHIPARPAPASDKAPGADATRLLDEWEGSL